MYIWEVLGIEPTTDVVAIKRAFAQKAKQYHPEEYPEEYKKLRNAYKKAIAQAKQQSQTQESEKTVAEKSAPEKPVHKKNSRATNDTFNFEDIFRKDQIVEVPPIEKPKLQTNRIERPNIEPPKLEAPRLDMPYLEITKQQVNNKRIIQENRQNREQKERKKPEMPSLKELLQQSSATPPVIEDPLRLYPEEKKKRRAQFSEIPKEFDFSFEEVERAYSPEEVEDFFYFFRAIANYPLLRDNIEIWTLFLETPELKDFFRREENCLRMIQTIEKYFWGKRDTILYFEFFLQVKTGEKIDYFQNSWSWKMKKWWGMLPKRSESKNLTMEETDLHNIILEELHRRNIHYDLIHYEAARTAYLETYLLEVKENRGTWKQRWMNGHKFRRDLGIKKIILGFLIPVVLVIVILLFGTISYRLGERRTNVKNETVTEQGETN